MNPGRPGKSIRDVVADFDAIAEAIAEDPEPDVLTLAERFLLKQVPQDAKRALDVGCGHGTLTRALAARGIATLGIDASPKMLALARSRADSNPLLEYRLVDVTRDTLPASDFDVVLSVSMAHHVALSDAVRFLRAALAPGGLLLIQDITTRTGLRYLPVNALAFLTQRLKLASGSSRRRREVKTLYEKHGAAETYLTPSEVERAYREILPGARIYHHLEWRYTAVWRAIDRDNAAPHIPNAN